MLPQSVKIIDLGFDGDVVCGNIGRRLASSPLVVIDQPERTRQVVEFRQEIVVIEIRPAVQHDNWSTASDLADIEPSTFDGHVTFPRNHLLGPASSR